MTSHTSNVCAVSNVVGEWRLRATLEGGVNALGKIQRPKAAEAVDYLYIMFGSHIWYANSPSEDTSKTRTCYTRYSEEVEWRN